MPTTWHARLDWTSTATTAPSTLADLLDDLSDHAPSGSLDTDGRSGSIMIALEAVDLEGAIASALESIRTALDRHLSGGVVTGLELLDSESLDRELSRPIFPEVVGYAEVADLAGVSRQRARAFSKIDGFPSPVIETAQGPLMAKAAVQQWLDIRNTRPGRPARA